MTDASYDELVAVMRAAHARPGGTGAVLNLVRGAAVRAATDLATLSELVTHADLQRDLARYAMDEARHAHLLLERMAEIDFRPFTVPVALDRLDALLARCRAREVRDVYAARGTVGDAEAMELLVATYLPKRHGIVELRASADALDGDARTRLLLGGMLRDAARHAALLEEWMRWFERRFSPRAVAAVRERLGRVFAEVDAVYRAALPAYLERAVDAGGAPVVRMAWAVGQ